MCRCLALSGKVRRENNFLNDPIGRAGEHTIKIKLIGTRAFERG
jgi:hypothetical protein